jgi:hypothetical protein
MTCGSESKGHSAGNCADDRIRLVEPLGRRGPRGAVQMPNRYLPESWDADHLVPRDAVPIRLPRKPQDQLTVMHPGQDWWCLERIVEPAQFPINE